MGRKLRAWDLIRPEWGCCSARDVGLPTCRMTRVITSHGGPTPLSLLHAGHHTVVSPQHPCSDAHVTLLRHREGEYILKATQPRAPKLGLICGVWLRVCYQTMV